MASAADVVRIAKAEMSEIAGAYLPNSTNGNKYCKWYGMSGYWCAMFVSYVMNKAGVSTSVAPKTASSQEFKTFGKQIGRTYSKSSVVSGSYTPKAGDLFIRDDGGGTGHVGIIVSVSGSGFTTIEGNTGGGGSGKRTVGSHTWTFSGGNYHYIFNPAYPDTSSSSTDTADRLAPQRQQVISVPSGLGAVYTWERWNRSDWLYNQKKLCTVSESRGERSYDNDGYGLVGDRYVIAMTDTFGTVGDYVDVYCDNGRIICGIIGDIKDQTTAHGSDHANKWGHYEGKNIVEWMTNWSSGHGNPSSDGYISKVINLGNYFEYPEYASASSSYMYSENATGEVEPTVVWNNRVKENIQPRLQDLPPLPETDELALYADDYNITAYTGDLSWKNSLQELATTMEFETAKTDAAYLSNEIYNPVLGSVVRMSQGGETFRGAIISIDDGDKNTNKYTAADMGWWLNKTEQTYQFKNITVTESITELCDDLCVPIVEIPELSENVNEIYFDKAASDIITDLLSKCSGEYNYDFTPDGLRIYEVGAHEAAPEIEVAGNVQRQFAAKYMGNVSRSQSIEDMVTSVKVTSEKDSVYTELTVLQNRENIDKYGFLQQLVKIDPETENADTTAKETLDENGTPKEEFSFTIVVTQNDYTRAGDAIEIDGVKYIVKSAEHTYSNGFQRVALDVRRA